MNKKHKPVLGFAAYSGTGKTTLIISLLPILQDKGLNVAMIKHAHHDFDIDMPGKDSYKLRKAGASQVLIASNYRRALITETPEGEEPKLENLISDLDLEQVDLVLVEGFRHLPFPKIELHRPSTEKELIYIDDGNVIAIASDEHISTGNLPLLNLNNPQEIADFIQNWLME
ncbi:MAG: molybdopterin-guanine dinucleotide biosynthesis protein MobB [Gammaproteobacteria bacterium]|nr:molybdopterin-guanine dinucleotide biosynthesis protein MobB [Gammaproteobacteria bacterium]